LDDLELNANILDDSELKANILDDSELNANIFDDWDLNANILIAVVLGLVALNFNITKFTLKLSFA